MIADFEEDVCAVIAESAVRLFGADNAECAEVEFLQQAAGKNAGQEITRVKEIAGEPAEGSIVRVVFIHALNKSM